MKNEGTVWESTVGFLSFGANTDKVKLPRSKGQLSISQGLTLHFARQNGMVSQNSILVNGKKCQLRIILSLVKLGKLVASEAGYKAV